MKSQDRDKKIKASEFGASPIQSHSDSTSTNDTPSCEEIRLRSR